jgi:hypothetical protein
VRSLRPLRHCKQALLRNVGPPPGQLKAFSTAYFDLKTACFAYSGVAHYFDVGLERNSGRVIGMAIPPLKDARVYLERGSDAAYNGWKQLHASPLPKPS